MGIWGFINLVIMYFSQLNFGVPSSLNVIASKEKQNTDYVIRVFNNTISISSILIIISIIFFTLIRLFNIDFGAKFSFFTYIIPTALIISFNFITPLFSNVLRIFGNIKEISISQSLVPLSMLAVSFFFKGQDLLWALLWSNMVALFITILVFLKVMPFKIGFDLNRDLIKVILSKGLVLFIYTSSFYFIIYSTRSIISEFYSVVEFGYFTFAFTLGNTVNMLLSSISFLVFPKVLNRMATLSNKEISLMLSKMRHTYIVSSHALIHFLIVVFPVFLYFFSQYQNCLQAFRLIALTLVLYTNSFGYQGLLLAKSKERLIATLSTLALVINVICGYLIAQVFKLPYSYVIIATLISYLIYIYLLTYFGRKTIAESTRLIDVLKDFFPFSMFIPFVLSFIFSVLSLNSYWFIIPLFLFLFLNFKSFKVIYNTFQEVLNNSKIINI